MSGCNSCKCCVKYSLAVVAPKLDFKLNGKISLWFARFHGKVCIFYFMEIHDRKLHRPIELSNEMQNLKGGKEYYDLVKVLRW